MLWTRILIKDVGSEPHSANQHQIMFKSKDGTPRWGCNAIYRVSHGRLAYGKNRVIVDFTHYNYFLDNGGHTGDGVFTFDANTGKDDKVAFIFKTSHSVELRLMYDGLSIFVASMGDMYPLNLVFDKVELKKDSEVDIPFKSLLAVDKSVIIGDGSGGSTGRFGSITDLNDTTIAVPYTRRKGTMNSHGVSENCEFSEFVLCLIDKALFTKNNIVLDSSSDRDIRFLKSAKYGSNFLIAYVSCPYESEPYGQNKPEKNYPVNFMMLDQEGNLLDEQKHEGLFVNGSSDFEILNNGNVIWTAIDENDMLFLIF